MACKNLRVRAEIRSGKGDVIEGELCLSHGVERPNYVNASRNFLNYQ
jgi:hypothetical protein